MAKRSEIMKLPKSVRDALDSKLRTGAYGDYEVLAEWLRSMGHETSKSSLHRYGQALRRVDAENGAQDAQVAQEMRVANGALDAQRTRLLQELGRLRYEEAKLLKRLTELDGGAD